MSKIFFSPDQCEHTDFKIFSFGGDLLSNEIASHLDISLGKHETVRFNDGEISIQLLDSVSGPKSSYLKHSRIKKSTMG
jgi:phosphoribosylpyrophosphate synthetase